MLREWPLTLHLPSCWLADSTTSGGEGEDRCRGVVQVADEYTLTASLTSETGILWRRFGGQKENSGKVSPMISEARSPQPVSPDEAVHSPEVSTGWK